MLGKCIKNEFVNRTGIVAGISVGVLAFSGVILGMNTLNVQLQSQSFTVFVSLLDMLFVFAMMAAVIVLVMLPSIDFRNRFFKDQGYLTHTLPVKTSTLIAARLVCDLVMIVWLALVYVLAICIATGDFSVFSEFVTFMQKTLSMMGSYVDRAMLITDSVLFLAMLWFGMLFSIWTINAAYCFGHAFSKGKRLLSVVFYILLNIVYTVLLIVANNILESSNIDAWMETIQTTAGQCLALFSIAVALEIIGVACLTIATSYMCKHKLNIE